MAGEEFAPLGEKIIGAALRVHNVLGPGLLENAYELCLFHELGKSGLRVQRQVALSVVYEEVRLDAGYRLDMLVAGKVVLELKAVERLQPLHTAQSVSYLRLGDFPLGYLLNFNVARMRDGIKRVINPALFSSETSASSV